MRFDCSHIATFNFEVLHVICKIFLILDVPQTLFVMLGADAINISGLLV